MTPPDALAGARFAIPAPDVLRAGAALGADPALPLPELRDRVAGLAHRYVDAVLDGFVLALARAARGVPGAGARTAGLVRGFADRFVTPGATSSRTSSASSATTSCARPGASRRP